MRTQLRSALSAEPRPSGDRVGERVSGRWWAGLKKEPDAGETAGTGGVGARPGDPRWRLLVVGDGGHGGNGHQSAVRAAGGRTFSLGILFVCFCFYFIFFHWVFWSRFSGGRVDTLVFHM